MQAAQHAGVIATAWPAADCMLVENGRKVPEQTRVYTRCDGVNGTSACQTLLPAPLNYRLNICAEF
jgi:hypothetical protein